MAPRFPLSSSPDERVPPALSVVEGGAAQAIAPAGTLGRVQIVGAGPGDPELLTLKALRALHGAEVVLYDKLVAPEILDYARRDAERIPVGKSKGHHIRSQAETNALMLRLARAGRRVLRLKGGDPFIFGRGGEEQAYLQAHGIEVEVIPGVTAAAGCAAAAGIPLTYRNVAQAVTFVTGHAADGEPDLDWAGLAGRRQTLAIYMGLSTAAVISQRLIEHGLDGATPVAVVENGTRPDQKTAVGTLSALEALLLAEGIKGPALIVVGEVVGLAASGELPVEELVPLHALAV